MEYTNYTAETNSNVIQYYTSSNYKTAEDSEWMNKGTKNEKENEEEKEKMEWRNGENPVYLSFDPK